jgi:hypothetical protein
VLRGPFLDTCLVFRRSRPQGIPVEHSGRLVNHMKIRGTSVGSAFYTYEFAQARFEVCCWMIMRAVCTIIMLYQYISVFGGYVLHGFRVQANGLARPTWLMPNAATGSIRFTAAHHFFNFRIAKNCGVHEHPTPARSAIKRYFFSTFACALLLTRRAASTCRNNKSAASLLFVIFKVSPIWCAPAAVTSHTLQR